VTFFGFQECRDIGLAYFQFQSCGYSVQRFDPLTFDVLAVLVKIDKPWSNDQASGGNHPLAGKSFSGDSLNFALRDANVANSVKACLRIEHPATLDYKIIILRPSQQGRQNYRKKENAPLHFVSSQ
jgi:hypothetical protein